MLILKIKLQRGPLNLLKLAKEMLVKSLNGKNTIYSAISTKLVNTAIIADSTANGSNQRFLSLLIAIT